MHFESKTKPNASFWCTFYNQWSSFSKTEQFRLWTQFWVFSLNLTGFWRREIISSPVTDINTIRLSRIACGRVLSSSFYSIFYFIFQTNGLGTDRLTRHIVFYLDVSASSSALNEDNITELQGEIVIERLLHKNTEWKVCCRIGNKSETSRPYPRDFSLR